MAKPSSTHRVVRYLEREIRGKRSGDSLPTVREIMRACRVSPQTVSEAVCSLERREWLEVRPKSGLYRTGKDTAGPAIDRVDVLYYNASERQRRMVVGLDEPDDTFHGEVLAALARCGERRELKVRCHAPEPDESDGDLAHRVADDPDVQACLVVSLVDASLVRTFEATQVPYVNLFPAGFVLPPNAISITADDVVGRQIEALTERGHRRIAYLHAVEDDHYHRDSLLRREGFYRLAVERGLEVHPGYVAHAGFEVEGVRRTLEGLLTLTPRPTGLICADRELPRVYEVAAGLGLRIGRDLSVVGTDDTPESSRVEPPATTLRVPREASVEKALDLLGEVARGFTRPATRPLPIEVRLVERGSVGPAPTA